MNLVIDIGNSRSKLAVFDQDRIVEQQSTDQLTVSQLQGINENYDQLQNCILSSVVKVQSELLQFLNKSHKNFIQLNHSTPLPIDNLYQTPETIGLDRLAAAVGAVTLFPGKDLLVIDAGTAITFDFINKKGQFIGGNISPGLKTRFRALHHFTDKLPLVSESDEWPLIGTTTEEAIRAGVQNGIIFEIEYMTEEINKKYPFLQTVLTGGDAFFFGRRLKSAIFVKSEVTLIGLNRILLYNVEKI